MQGINHVYLSAFSIFVWHMCSRRAGYSSYAKTFPNMQGSVFWYQAEKYQPTVKQVGILIHSLLQVTQGTQYKNVGHSVVHCSYDILKACNIRQ